MVRLTFALCAWLALGACATPQGRVTGDYGVPRDENGQPVLSAGN
jgi:hypothetical protein